MVVVMVITTIYDLGSTLLLEQGQIALKVKISILKLWHHSQMKEDGFERMIWSTVYANDGIFNKENHSEAE